MPLFGFFRRRRRARTLSEPFPDVWRRILRRRVHYYTLLPSAEQALLEGHVQVLLAEKHFEGCDGFEITDDVRVSIAGFAAMLILHEPGDYYPGLQSILVYPEAFVVPIEEEGPDGVVGLDPEERAGESWDRGAVILAWEEVVEGGRDSGDGYNVVLHEFAHQIDFYHRGASVMEGFELRNGEDAWSAVFEDAYEDLVKAVRGNRRPLLDEYGATNPAEFFAVATETFFERPIAMQRRHAELYGAMRTFYGQDPAGLVRASRG